MARIHEEQEWRGACAQYAWQCGRDRQRSWQVGIKNSSFRMEVRLGSSHTEVQFSSQEAGAGGSGWAALRGRQRSLRHCPGCSLLLHQQGPHLQCIQEHAGFAHFLSCKRNQAVVRTPCWPPAARAHRHTACLPGGLTLSPVSLLWATWAARTHSQRKGTGVGGSERPQRRAPMRHLARNGRAEQAHVCILHGRPAKPAHKLPQGVAGSRQTSRLTAVAAREGLGPPAAAVGYLQQ